MRKEGERSCTARTSPLLHASLRGPSQKAKPQLSEVSKPGDNTHMSHSRSPLWPPCPPRARAADRNHSRTRPVSGDGRRRAVLCCTRRPGSRLNEPELITPAAPGEPRGPVGRAGGDRQGWQWGGSKAAVGQYELLPPRTEVATNYLDSRRKDRRCFPSLRSCGMFKAQGVLQIPPPRYWLTSQLKDNLPSHQTFQCVYKDSKIQTFNFYTTDLPCSFLYALF